MRLRMLPFAAIAIASIAVLSVAVAMAPASHAYPLPYQYPTGGAEHVFSPPGGWNRVQATTPGLGVWLHPGDNGFAQSLAARASQFGGSQSDLVQQMISKIKQQHPDVKLGSVQHATVCGGHPATYLTYAATVDKRPLIYEQMLTLYKGTAYSAIYTRAADQPSIPVARESLTTLCGGHPPAGAPTPSPPGSIARPAVTLTPSSVNTPQPFGTTGYPVPTVTPRTGP